MEVEMIGDGSRARDPPSPLPFEESHHMHYFYGFFVYRPLWDAYLSICTSTINIDLEPRKYKMSLLKWKWQMETTSAIIQEKVSLCLCGQECTQRNHVVVRAFCFDHHHRDSIYVYVFVLCALFFIMIFRMLRLLLLLFSPLEVC